MAPSTRRSARNKASPASSTTGDTPTTLGTPIFSTRTSVAGDEESPNTSDMDEDVVPIKREAPARSSKLKRSLNVSEEEAQEESEVSIPARKRRAVAKRVYVQVPEAKFPRGKEKAQNDPQTVKRASFSLKPVQFCEFKPSF